MEQNEVDQMMQEISQEAGSAPPKQEAEINWDDVKDELEKSRQPAQSLFLHDPGRFMSSAIGRNAGSQLTIGDASC
jgi:hypothetical protein